MKQRRTVLSGIVTPFRDEAEALPAPSVVAEPAAPRKSATKAATVQQTLYLPPAVHDQLRDLAHAERVKMHWLVMEGLDAVFRKRGMKSIADLTRTT